MSLILACGAGVYIGLYFNVLALFPFTVLGASAFIMSAWASGQSPLDSAITLVPPLISCQAGYMLGLTARGVYGQLLSRLNFGQSKQV
jgi:hypothetical protein